MDLSDSLQMQPDLDHLIWLYSIGLEDVVNEGPINQFNEKYKNDLENEVFEDKIFEKRSNKQKIIKAIDKSNSFIKISEEINQLKEVSHLESYFKKFLNREFDLNSENRLYSDVAKRECNLIVITETPLMRDFRKGEVYSGKKKSLLDGIILSIKLSLKEKDFGVIMVPVSPFPIGEISDQDRFARYHFLFLDKVIRIINPILLVLIGERSNNLIKKLKGIEKEKHNSQHIPYLSIPELQYILSVPKTKKYIWDDLKNLIKRGKDESLL